jgi:hypothetical protein
MILRLQKVSILFFAVLLILGCSEDEAEEVTPAASGTIQVSATPGQSEEVVLLKKGEAINVAVTHESGGIPSCREIIGELVGVWASSQTAHQMCQVGDLEQALMGFVKEPSGALRLKYVQVSIVANESLPADYRQGPCEHAVGYILMNEAVRPEGAKAFACTLNITLDLVPGSAVGRVLMLVPQSEAPQIDPANAPYCWELVPFVSSLGAQAAALPCLVA